jgi:VIT1/CCC1 family predicted Fe2+/Mn2+ transporter
MINFSVFMARSLYHIGRRGGMTLRAPILFAVGAELDRIANEQAREELFAHRLYTALAQRFPEGESRRMMSELARQERTHVDFWLSVTGESERSLRVPRLKYALLVLASRFLGPAFTIRWLERGEDRAIASYKELLTDGALSGEQADAVRKMLAEEEEHEQLLEQGIEDERRLYLGAAVLGLNDALVELTGGLTGLVSSIRDTKLIAFASLVVGVAAAMSMAASNFLSVDIGEASELKPGKAAAYTGTAYIFVVIALVLPFFLLSDRHVALAISWAAAVLVIAAFSYYSSVMQGARFLRRFATMLALGMGVAVISFFIGRALGAMIGIETV